ncbi:hypothetical protein [Streptomyces sp. NPDC054863]
MDGFGLDGLLPSGFYDGAEVSLDLALELVRIMLRDGGAWCRLEVEDTFAVHVGRDQYLYISSSRPCEKALARTRGLGLFPERMTASPYAFEAEEAGVQRPGSDEFWSDVHRAFATGQAGILEETYLEGASRWHHLTCEIIETVCAEASGRTRTATSAAPSPTRTSSRNCPPGSPVPRPPRFFPCTRVNVCLCVLLSCRTTTGFYGLVGGPARHRATAAGRSAVPRIECG